MLVFAMTELSAALSQHFGYTEFLPGQEAVIGHLLAGRSAAAVFPTGGGKSLCYQLPALLIEGVVLVVSPLIALMKDQIDALQVRGIAARRLDSSLSLDEYREVMDGVREQSIRLLYVSPERFNNERFRLAMQGVRIGIFAVDEAHCISEWGHNFRPDYLKLPGYARQFAAERILALTATATDRVLADMCRGFDIDPACAVRNQFYRPNLALSTQAVGSERRQDELVRALKSAPAGPAIVYVTLQRTAEEVAERLAAEGLPARAYHAGMEDDVRHQAQDWFLASADGIMAATIAFGMGIDKSNIRAVYHYNLPKSLENYAQEIGRAGRDGAPAECRMLACPGDLNVLENFIYGDTPGEAALRGLLTEIFSQPQQFDVNFHHLASAHDIRLLVVRTLMTYLELDEYLRGGTPFYSSYQFKPLQSSAQILEGFSGERRNFLRAIFARSVRAKTWFHLDLDEAARELGWERDRIVKALDYLGERGMLEVKAAGVRHRYSILRRPSDLEELTARMVERAAQREQAELARLGDVLDFIQCDGCQVSYLNAHFHEPLPSPCGHCSWCLDGNRPTVMPARPDPEIDRGVWIQAVEFRHNHPDELGDPRAFARFLCGISSPRLTRSGLTKHTLFGVQSGVRYPALLSRAEAE